LSLKYQLNSYCDIHYPDQNGISYLSSDLNHLISDSIFLKKEKGNYNLEWLRFLTEEGIKEFPIIPGMDLEEDFKLLFEKLSNKENPT
jgi:hypothetical protein